MDVIPLRLGYLAKFMSQEKVGYLLMTKSTRSTKALEIRSLAELLYRAVLDFLKDFQGNLVQICDLKENLQYPSQLQLEIHCLSMHLPTSIKDYYFG
ncbi:hypothetical protein AVEN_168242-1 [Araneus ventricosus]|uniref:Uncharacterized protein n=1 Tax=Araneus ventricosus TaxID=182803 RepID=A0A4Y2J4S3_ARAVE|nr:hypothetical protein AVEN_168242-1 [Araneus ventricosus]